MALRFRKSVKVMPGVRLNFSGSGTSLSMGGKGARVNFSKRGTRTTVGIPGTGLSYSSHSSSARQSRQLEREEKQRRREQALSRVSVKVDDDGVLTCLDSFGEPLKGRDLSLLWEKSGDDIVALLEGAAEKINGDVDLLADIHLDSPSPDSQLVLEHEEFTLPEPQQPKKEGYPTEPIMPTFKKVGFISGLIGGHKRQLRKIEQAKIKHQGLWGNWKQDCDGIDKHYSKALGEWKESHSRWLDKKDEHERSVKAYQEEYEEQLRSDIEFASSVLEQQFSTIEWPRETLIAFQLNLDRSEAWLDIDLPEIEDLPQRVATFAASGKKLNVKNKSQKDLRLEYARHIHGIIFRIAATTAATLPEIQNVYVSGYSQRLDPATGNINDDYLLSIKFTRQGLNAVNFERLAQVDPVVSVETFDHRRKMTATGVFKPIEPFCPN